MNGGAVHYAGKSEQPRREIHATGLVPEAHVLTNHSLCILLAFCSSVLTNGMYLSIYRAKYSFFQKNRKESLLSLTEDKPTMCLPVIVESWDKGGLRRSVYFPADAHW